MPKSSNGGEQGHNFWDLALNGLDDTVTPAILSFGMLGQDSSGVYHRVNVSSTGYLMVSGSFAGTVSGGSFSSSPLSADSSSVSAKQGDAGLLRVSGRSDDAGLFRVSALGSFSATTSPLSADSSNVSAKQGDAGLLHVSAIVGTGATDLGKAISASIGTADTGIALLAEQVSALTLLNTPQHTYNQLRVGPYGDLWVSLATRLNSTDDTVTAVVQSNDASVYRVSAIQPAAANLFTSAFNTGSSDNLLVSAKSKDAGTLLTSAKQGDAGNLRTSAILTFSDGTAVNQSGGNVMVNVGNAATGTYGNSDANAANLTSFLTFTQNQGYNGATWDRLRTISASGTGLGVLQVGQTDAGLNHVSAYSPDAGLFRVSALGVTVTASPLSSDSSSISAKQGDANNLHISAFSNDAGLMRVSAVGGSTVSLSADASGNRVSAVQLDAGNLMVSAKSGDAGLFRVSALGVTVTTSPLSADSSSISAKQSDAGNLHVSAFLDSGSVSAKSATASQFVVSAAQSDAGVLRISARSDDAGLFRVSALGVTVTTSPLSASSSTISAVNGDAGTLHVSAFLDSGSVSAKSSDAGTFRVSAINSVSALSPDAGLFRISALGTITVSAHEVKQSDASSMLVSAKSGDGNQFHVSAVQGDAGLFHVSAVGTLTVSAHEVKQSDASSLLTSAKSGDANQFHISAVQGDSGLLHVSASLMPDTTGGLTIYDSISVSSSAVVKSTAGALYGYYLWNTDTKPNYVKFYNLSGGMQIGTDTPKLVVMVPASAAANMWFGNGLAGFTAGISIGATSAVADNATSLPNTSAVGAQIFYK